MTRSPLRRAGLAGACLLAAVLPGVWLHGCGDGPAEERVAFVSIPPQAYFAERIAGDRFKVVPLLGPGDSPATYSPPMKQMVELDHAALYLRIGVPFEQALLPKIDTSDGRPRIVDTSRGVAMRSMKPRDADHDHDHHDHGHEHGARDPHIWLSPRRVQTVAATMAEAFIAADPEHAEEYRRNLEAFQADLDALDRELEETLGPLAGQKIYVYHPAYGYLAEDYGLVQEPVEIEGKQPSEKRIGRIAENAVGDGVRVIFVQPQFSDESARTLADEMERLYRADGRDVSVAVVPMDPLARDYLANMRTLAGRIRDALSGGGD